MTNISKQDLWKRFIDYYSEYPELGLALDLSRVNWPNGFVEHMQPKINQAFKEMDELEKGAIANPDEHRMVGHYWLRDPERAPDIETRTLIRSTVERIKSFAATVHSGEISGNGGKFKNIIVIGIGGSALGPLFVSNALGSPTKDKMSFFISDNTDPDGMDSMYAKLGQSLSQTLCVVISKSGGTRETRNGMLEAKAAYERFELKFNEHAVAITQEGSLLDKYAVENNWIARFPMWDWVGGRTSELSAVGLLPAALQGVDIEGMLGGARDCDAVTRTHDAIKNPAMRMALAWYSTGNGKGDRNLVFLPYKDRLELLSKYLQQLIMESLGKEHDKNGNVVNQGFSVFGNKGSTDQHSFVQQLRDGRNDFIVTFIEVLKGRSGQRLEVEPGLTAADFLQGFLLGTRTALFDKGRPSITITVDDVTPRMIGILIALFERTVGYYASLIGINAYHQPGVEAGKKAAGQVVELQRKVMSWISSNRSRWLSSGEIANGINAPDDVEAVFKLCTRLAADEASGMKRKAADSPDQTQFCMT